MIDLAEMRAVAVDPERRTARAQGGANWNELNAATAEHGLAVTGGAISTTGIAGLTLGGGLGWLMGLYGLAADNLVSVELVTADGNVLNVTAESEPDLFWALRGGGGNFGVATTFEYQLHEVTMVTGGLVAHPFAAAGDMLRFYREFTRTVPDELTVFAGARPRARRLRDEARCAMVVCHAGSPEQAEKDLAPLLEFGPPRHDPGRADAVSRDEHVARRRVPTRRAQLLEVELPPRPRRRLHRAQPSRRTPPFRRRCPRSCSSTSTER